MTSGKCFILSALHGSTVDTSTCVSLRWVFAVFLPLPSGQERVNPVHRYTVSGGWPPEIGAAEFDARLDRGLA